MPQGVDRIDAGSPRRRRGASDECRCGQQCRYESEGLGIHRLDIVQQADHQAAQARSSGETDDDAS